MEEVDYEEDAEKVDYEEDIEEVDYEVDAEEVDYEVDTEEVDYELYMRPSLASAIVDLLKYYECRQVWYLYNSNEGTAASTFCRRQRLYCAMH